MEFPDIGESCSIEDCKQLNFLPFICDHCRDTFCKDHFHVASHKCKNFHENKRAKAKMVNYSCSEESCKETSPTEMQCVKCEKHYCLKHRYHGCQEPIDGKLTKKLKKWQISKKQFAEAKAVVDKEILDSLKKSKNTAMANKVRLMRVKGSAVGPKNVPMNERCYFLVYPPSLVFVRNTRPSKGVFVNVNWTIGQVIDSMATLLRVSNNNNIAGATKLRLFHHSTGALICNETDIPLTKLLENSDLVDGQSVVLEYSSDTSIDTALYK